MSATLVTLTRNDIFKSAGNADHMIKIPKVDDIMGNAGLAIYDTVSYQLNETIQYFLTFDDVVKFIHFGKGVGSLVANGLMFSDCDGEIIGLKKFEKAITDLRGKEQKITIGSAEFTAIMTSVQITITSDPDTMAHFTFNFSIVDHSL